MVKSAATVTATTVIEAIGRVYNQFGFEQTELPERFAALLNDPAKSVVEDEGDASVAAEEIRKTLWSWFTGGGTSASATCQLFHVLGRENELGWIKGEARGFIFIP